jgi:hypothetical protein
MNGLSIEEFTNGPILTSVELIKKKLPHIGLHNSGRHDISYFMPRRKSITMKKSIMQRFIYYLRPYCIVPLTGNKIVKNKKFAYSSTLCNFVFRKKWNKNTKKNKIKQIHSRMDNINLSYS